MGRVPRQASNVSVQLGELRALKEQIVDARIRAVDAESELKKARLRGLRSEPLESFVATYNELKASARRIERQFAEKLSQVCTLARSVPELIAELVQMQEEHVSHELLRFTHAEQASILSFFSSTRRLSDYDDELQNMQHLSSEEARHRVLATRYSQDACVLKVFELHMRQGRGLQRFLSEVELHARLSHPLVVPLGCAFLDWESQRGFLHFAQYPYDLRSLVERPELREHFADHDVFRAVRAMVQSVAHLQASKVVHGDLKLSNWLWDPGTCLPLLCDFETARTDAAGQACTRTMPTATARLRSEGYAAPELREGGTGKKTFQSDAFALGRSISEVLRRPAPWRPESAEEWHALQAIAERMMHEEPSQRLSAQDAEQEIMNISVSSASPASSVVLINCEQIFFTQQHCSGRFLDGRTLGQLIDQIVDHPGYVTTRQSLIIDAVQKGKRGNFEIFSTDNRRLFCFKEALKVLRQRGVQEQLHVQVRLRKLDKDLDRFLDHHSTSTRGRHIRVR